MTLVGPVLAMSGPISLYMPCIHRAFFIPLTFTLFLPLLPQVFLSSEWSNLTEISHLELSVPRPIPPFCVHIISCGSLYFFPICCRRKLL